MTFSIAKVLSAITLFLAVACGSVSAAARSSEIFLNAGGLFSSTWDYAVDGHDVVAYFSLSEDDAPVQGSEEYIADYKGVEWLFSSAENLAKFQSNPAAYAPQYGGYCAWALARDKLAKGDPAVWYVYGGKLYLNVSARYQREWLADINGDITRGDANWPGILDRK